MKTETKPAAHTPRNLKVDPAQPHIICEGYSTVAEVSMTFGLNSAIKTAAFIVRAVNCHDELVAALQRALNQLEISYNPSESQVLELSRSEAQWSTSQIRAAIAKAKGQL